MRLFIAMFTLCACLGQPVCAVEVEKVRIPDSVELGGKTLVLNGTGIRKKLFVKVYIGALYLEKPAASAAEALAATGPRRMSMHILHGEIGKDKLVNGHVKVQQCFW